MRILSTIAVVLVSVLLEGATPVRAVQSPGEAVASDISKRLPDGWTCALIFEKGKMGHPHGLEEPLFRLDFVNESLAFPVEDEPGQKKLVHPNLRLHFHASAERERILKTIKAEELYSWAIPILFADTRDYIVVTSPLWQNHGSTKVGNTTWAYGTYTDEANKLIAPLLGALTEYFRARKETVAVPAMGAQSPPSKGISELLAALKDPTLSERQKQGFVRSVFSGVVEVREVQEVPLTPSKDRPWDSLPTEKPAVRIMVDVGMANQYWYELAFQTTDLEWASKLKKGEKIALSGRLVQFVTHKRGHNDTTDDQWLIFDQVVIGGK